jgi:uncharacterized protein with WD repeat
VWVTRLTLCQLLDFSPCENYLVTISAQFQENDNPRDPQCIIVWDIRSGKKLRGFLSGGRTQWPAFLWSHDDKYPPHTAYSRLFEVVSNRFIPIL